MNVVLVITLLGVVGLLRVCASRGETIVNQDARIAELERDLKAEREKTVNRFRPRPLDEWVTKPSSAPALIQGRPRQAALPAGTIDRPYSSAVTQQIPKVDARVN